MLDEFRRQMPITAAWKYFDHAAVAPLSRPAEQTLQKWLQEATNQGDTVWLKWAAAVENVRNDAARLVNAKSAEIAFVSNTTAGLHAVAQGISWKPGDNVVVPDNEFPSNQYVWNSLAPLGVETIRVPTPRHEVWPENLVAACNQNTRLISVSWVGYASGWRIDVEELCRLAHQRGIPVLLDAIQGLGVYPLDVRETQLDFFAADGHKWLLAPEGAALFYIREDWIDRLRPSTAGWNSVNDRYNFDRHDFTLRDSAARFEGGSLNMAGIMALGASLNMLLELGVGPKSSPIEGHVVALRNQIAEGFSRLRSKSLCDPPPERRSAISTWIFEQVDPLALRKWLLDHQVATSVRGGGLRIAPHGYNDTAEVQRLLELVEVAIKEIATQ